MSDEFDHEPIPGLPQLLPEGETLLWQGSPAWRGVLRRVLHAELVAMYFGILIVWCLMVPPLEAVGILAVTAPALRVAIAGLAALSVLTLLARAISRTTIYTITDRRVVMRYGVALPITFNLPFKAIASAGHRPFADATGDITLALAGDDRIAFFHLWPHVRPWRINRPEPMLRSVPDSLQVAELLGKALSGEPVRPLASRASEQSGTSGSAIGAYKHEAYS
ncbi:MAG: photosynthetic complex putative assembly protein PuhB [Hyphomicrobium sp.]